MQLGKRCKYRFAQQRQLPGDCWHRWYGSWLRGPGDGARRSCIRLGAIASSNLATAVGSNATANKQGATSIGDSANAGLTAGVFSTAVGGGRSIDWGELHRSR
jgi:hypothetical protein